MVEKPVPVPSPMLMGVNYRRRTTFGQRRKRGEPRNRKRKGGRGVAGESRWQHYLKSRNRLGRVLRAGTQIGPASHGPVMANVTPGMRMLAKSHLPSGLNVAAHSYLRKSPLKPFFSPAR